MNESVFALYLIKMSVKNIQGINKKFVLFQSTNFGGIRPEMSWSLGNETGLGKSVDADRLNGKQSGPKQALLAEYLLNTCWMPAGSASKAR